MSGQRSASILVVASQFNEMVTRALLDGAMSVLGTHSDVVVEEVWVPGCFEIPVVAANAARSGRYAAIITLGCVIRGETPHFDYVAGQAAAGVMRVAIDTGIPVVFGVLTTDTIEQALNRSGLKYGNKGCDAAKTALHMIDVARKFPPLSARGNQS